MFVRYMILVLNYLRTLLTVLDKLNMQALFPFLGISLIVLDSTLHMS